MWWNNVGGDWTNNRCEGFHDGLHQASPLVHQNPYVLIELLRKTEKDSSECFGQYIRGVDVYRSPRKRKVAEKIRKALEMYQSLNAVIISRRFLDRVTIAYIDFDNDEKLTRERSAYEAMRPFGKVDMFEICWNSKVFLTIAAWLNPSLMKWMKRRKYCSIQLLKILHTQNSGKAYAPPRLQPAMKLMILFVRMSNPVPQEELSKQLKQNKNRNVRKKSFFWRLEDARNGACRGLPV